MPLLQPRLNLKVSQRQILTPGLMQMVSVLALNKLELTEMINAENWLKIQFSRKSTKPFQLWTK